METLQLQSAGAAAPTLPALSVPGGAPIGNGLFALTLGQTLENLASSIPDESALLAKVSSRQAEVADDSPDAPSLAGMLLNCFASNVLQSTPTVALNTNSPESALIPESPVSTSDSPANFTTAPNTLVDETSPNGGAPSVPAAMGGSSVDETSPNGGAPAVPAAMGGSSVDETSPNGGAPSVPAAMGGSSVGGTSPNGGAPSVPAAMGGSSVGGTSPNAGTPSIVTVLAGVAAPGNTSARAGQNLEPNGPASAEASKTTPRKRGQVSNQSSGLVSAIGQDGLNDVAIPQTVSAWAWFPGLQSTRVSSQGNEWQVEGAQSESNPPLNSRGWSRPGLGDTQRMPASRSLPNARPRLERPDPTLQPTVPQPPLSQEMLAAPTPAPSAGQTPTAASLPASQANNGFTSTSASTQPNLAAWSSLPREVAGTDEQGASDPVPSRGQAPLVATVHASDADNPSAAPSPTGYSNFAESWGLPGDFTGADGRVDSNPEPSKYQIPLSVYVNAGEAASFSVPLSAIDSSKPAEPSNLLGISAGTDVQTCSHPTLTPGQTGQPVLASGSNASESFTPSIAADHAEPADFSSLLGRFAGAEINLKVFGNESQQATVQQSLTMGSAAGATTTTNNGLPKAAAQSVESPAPKSGDLVDNPAKIALHSGQVNNPVSGQVSNSATAEGNWQNVPEPASATAQIALSLSAGPIPSPQASTKLQSVPLANPLQKPAAAEPTSYAGTRAAESGESPANAALADSSTSGQGKAGQQSGSAPGDNAVGARTFTPGLVNDPAAASSTNLVAINTAGVPTSHASTSAPPTPTSSSQPPTTLSAWQNYVSGAGQVVHSASLSDTVNGAEMRVELRSGTLGPLDVRAVLHEGSVGAEIHVQGQEAHTLLAAGLPSLERAMGERNLRVENLAVYKDHAGGEMSGGERQESESGSYHATPRQFLTWDSPPQPHSATSGSAEDENLANPASGLSVRA